jgi:murein DD-endopeptidase MepM/ murein hydrolase activator NlpD
MGLIIKVANILGNLMKRKVQKSFIKNIGKELLFFILAIFIMISNSPLKVTSSSSIPVVVNSVGGCPSIGKVSVNAVYGYSNGYFGGSRFHNGIDLNFIYNDVYSIRGGVVIFAGWDVMGGGNMMIVRSGEMDVWYAHLSNFKVRIGQRVDMGDRIAISGNSGGLSTGAHLHLTIKVGGRFVNPVGYLRGCIK